MRTLLALLVFSPLLAACAAPARPLPERPAPAHDQLRLLPMYDGATGARLSWDDAADRLAQADAVLFGEEHGHPVGLPAAAALFEKTVLVHRWDAVRADNAPYAPGALALEFWERDTQHEIDAYLAGDVDRATFEEGRGSAYPRGHRDMLETAKEASWAVAAANAPRRFVRRARTEGYDALRENLTDEERALLVIPDTLDEGPYRDRFFGLMGGMAGHNDDAESDGPDPVVMSFYRAQQVWDATMADSVARLVDAGHTPTVLVIGRFHTDHQGATTTRTRALLEGGEVVTVTFAGRDLGLLGLHPEDRGVADIVIYTGGARRLR